MIFYLYSLILKCSYVSPASQTTITVFLNSTPGVMTNIRTGLALIEERRCEKTERMLIILKRDKPWAWGPGSSSQWTMTLDHTVLTSWLSSMNACMHAHTASAVAPIHSLSLKPTHMGPVHRYQKGLINSRRKTSLHLESNLWNQ